MNEDVLHRGKQRFVEQHARIQQEYRRQSVFWAWRSPSLELRDFAARIDVGSQDHVLDVAAGTGLLGRTLAPRAKSVVAIDLTPEMLSAGTEAAKRDGIDNMTFVQGAAESLSFPQGEFDLVVTRYSLHHMVEPQSVVDEMARVARIGGRVALIDMLSPDDPVVAHRYNELERWRDPSHTRAPTREDLRVLVDRAGATLTDEFVCDIEDDVDDWLAIARPDARAKIEEALKDELQGSGLTGLRPSAVASTLTYKHTVGLVVARR